MQALPTGTRVRVKREQQRLGGARFPGRTGTITGPNLTDPDNYVYVDLDATKRAMARPRELFHTRDLEACDQRVDLAIEELCSQEAALSACLQLVQAYRLGEERGGSVDWDDLDRAHATALKAVRGVGGDDQLRSAE